MFDVLVGDVLVGEVAALTDDELVVRRLTGRWFPVACRRGRCGAGSGVGAGARESALRRSDGGDSAKTLLDHASSLTFEDFRLCVRRWEMLADVDGAQRDAEAAVGRRTATVVEFDGVLHVDARGGAVHAASMIEIFQRFCDAEFATDWASVRDRFGADAPPDPESHVRRRTE